MGRANYFLLLAFSAAACSQQDNRICETPAAMPSRASQCVHRLAYLMADAEGSIADIAKAVAHKCNDYVLEDSLVAAGKGRDPDTTLKFYEEEALGTAFQRVAEARSGNCDKPSK